MFEMFKFAPPYGIDVIKQILPHRYPFLLIDQITDIGDDYIRGYKHLTANEPVFQGHFPDKAVYPGVLQVETIAQLGACWILSRHENLGKIAYLMSIESAKFRQVARPGDRLDAFGKITNLKSRTGRFVAEIRVNEQVISEATVLFAFQKNEVPETVCETSGAK